MPSVSTGYRRHRATIGLLLLAWISAGSTAATTFKQPGFSESVVFTGLTNPAVVRFLPDGRVLVAEKSGLLKIFPNLTTNTYTVVGDLRTATHNFWDRGLLGLAVPPGFDPDSPDEWRRYVYVLYTHNPLVGGVPRWPTAADGYSDTCPAPPAGPGATTDGCVVSGRLSRLPADGSNWTEPGEEEVLLEDWCQQFPSHATGAIDFGLDDKLYVSGGDGASFNAADWGQLGGTIQVQGSPGTYYTPANPCGDPPFALGTPQTKPTARGGALRSQSPRRPPGEARLLNGAILRVDPATGDPLPDNPLFSSSDPNEQRVLAYGLRNPFRMIVRPGTNEVFVADVGWNSWEELNRIPDLSLARNFGWPCFEGNAAQYTGLNICPSQAQTVAPFLTYHHSASTVGGDGCSVGSSSIAGMAFYQGASNYPAEFEDALFFSDYSRKCMWVMFPDVDGNPDPASTEAFANTVATGPVDLQIGPDGNLYYVDFNGGRIMRVKYGLNAVASATPTSGTAPLLVDFNGSATTPAQAGDDLVYAWDLDGDGEYDDSSEVSPSHTFTTPGTFTARLRVTDERDAVDFSDPIQISAGNTAPTAVIDTPLPSLAWKVNDAITFGGHGEDAQEEDQKVPEENLEWVVRIQHCPSDCHPHTYQTFSGVAGGSFPAPDHEYPAHLEIELTATDSQGLAHTTTVSIHPETVSLQFQTIPTGRQLSVGTFTGTAPFSRTVIRNSGNEVDALAPQGTFPNVWDFGSWSDGGAEQHSITASASATYTATFATHADLSISASASPEPVGAGAALTYTLTVANAGPSQASSLSVSHSLPAGSSFQSASGAGWACSGTGPVTCTMDSLGIASAAPISIAVTAPPDAGVISASSSVSSATADSAAANNSASTTSNAFARADLSVTQSGVPASVCSGQPISYTLNVSNAGSSAATSVSVTDLLPAGASLVSAAGAGWACSGTTTVTCTRASLAVGAAPAITVAITAPASAGTATNSVSVASATNDPSSANDSAAASTTVKSIPAPPTATNSGETCTGDPLQLFASAVAGAAYAWTGPNGFSSTLQNPTIPNATPAASGTYSVTVTVEGCTSAAATTNAHVHPIPSGVVSGTAAICAGSSTTIQAVLTGTGPWTVVWSDGVTQSNVASSPVTRSVSPAATTTYIITTFSDIYCVGTDTGAAVITVAPIPTAVVTGTAQVCAGSSTPIQAALTGTGPWTVVWSDGVAQSNVLASPATRNVSPAATATYTVTAVSDASCAGGAGSGGAVVTVQPPPTATISGTAAICAGSSTQIQAVLTGTGPWTVVWSDGLSQSNVAASPATRSVSPATTTTYTVTSVTDTQCAASGAGSAVVTVAPRPTAVASGSAEICPGGTTPLSGSGGASCLWAPAAGLSDAASCAPTASPSATTTYTLTVTDASGCVSSNAPAVTITVNPIPSPPTAGNGGEVCVGDTLQLTASTIAGASYAWTGPNGFTSTLQNPTISNATTAASGLYSVSATVAGCGSSEATTSALVRPLPTALVSGDATICAGDSTQLSVVLGGTGPWNLTWSDGHVQSAQTSPAIRNVSPSETTTYTVTAIADAHCTGPGAGAAAIVVGTPVDAPAVTAPLSAAVDATGLAASVADHEGSTYAWTVSSGAITSGQGTRAITFDAGPAGTTMTVSVVETNTTCSSPAAKHALQVDFLDVPPPHIFHDYVNTIARHGVTAGCGDGNFCPGGPNTREQMAVFLLKSKFGADYVPPPAVGVFSDVPIDSTFAPWVEKVAALQISVGCGGGKFCPGQPVTRGQMAVFLLKTLLGFEYVPPVATGTLFGDVPPGPFAAWIEDLYNRGVTGGCLASPLLYCPATPVTRGQMAVFLARTFGL